MNKQKHTVSSAMDKLTDDARNLMTATTDVAEEKVGEARKRLADTLERGREIYDSVLDKTIESTKSADKAVRKHPYQAAAIGLGAGALFGYIVGRNANRNHRTD